MNERVNKERPVGMKRKPGDDGRDPVESKTQPRDLAVRLARDDMRKLVNSGTVWNPPRSRLFQVGAAALSQSDNGLMAALLGVSGLMSQIVSYANASETNLYKDTIYFYELGDAEVTVALFGKLEEHERMLFIVSLEGCRNVNIGVIVALLDKYPPYLPSVLRSMKCRMERDEKPFARPGHRQTDVVALVFALEADQAEETVEERVRRKFDQAKEGRQCPWLANLRVMLDLVPALAENKCVFPARQLFPLYYSKGWEPLAVSHRIAGLFSSDVMYVSEKTFAWKTDLLREIGVWEEFQRCRITCKEDADMLNEADESLTPIRSRNVSDCGLQLPDGKIVPFKNVIVNTGADLAWMPVKLADDLADEKGYQVGHVLDKSLVLAQWNHSQERGDAVIDVRIPKLYVATAGTRGRLVSELRVLEVDGRLIHEEKKAANLAPTATFVVDSENHRCYAFVVGHYAVDFSAAKANIPAGRSFDDCLGQAFSLDDAVLVHFFNVDRVMIHRVEEALGIQYENWARGGDPGAIQVSFDSVIRP